MKHNYINSKLSYKYIHIYKFNVCKIITFYRNRLHIILMNVVKNNILILYSSYKENNMTNVEIILLIKNHLI